MSPGSPPRSDSRRFAWSFVAALVGHAGLAALVLSAPQRPTLAGERLTIELREVAPAPARLDRASTPIARPPRSKPVVLPPPLPEPEPEPVPENVPEEVTEPSDSPSIGAPVAAGGDSLGAPGASGDEGSDDTTEAAAGATGGGRPGGGDGVDSFHPEALDRALEQWRSVRGPGEEAEIDGPGLVPFGHGDNSETAEKGRVEQRIARGHRKTEAESRVAAGLVDPYFQVLRRAANQRLKPQRADLGIKEGLEGYVQSLVASWSGAGKKWAETGSPLRDPDSLLTLTPERNAEVDGSALRGRLPDPGEYAWLWNSGQLATQLFVVEIELVQQPDGAPIVARILKPSNSKRFDTLAKETLLASAEEHGAPAHGLGLGGTRITSHWRVEAQPIPNTPSAVTDPANGGAVIGLAASGVFDEVLGEGPTMPGEIRIIHRITLLAVYGGERGPTDAPDAGH